LGNSRGFSLDLDRSEAELEELLRLDPIVNPLRGRFAIELCSGKLFGRWDKGTAKLALWQRSTILS